MEKQPNRQKGAIKKHRLKELRQRKGYLSALIVNGVLLIFFTLTVFFIDPAKPWAIPVFLGTVFFVLFLSFALLINHTRRGFLISAVLTGFLLLSYLKVGTLINLFLLIGIATAFEFYFIKNY